MRTRIIMLLITFIFLTGCQVSKQADKPVIQTVKAMEEETSAKDIIHKSIKELQKKDNIKFVLKTETGINDPLYYTGIIKKNNLELTGRYKEGNLKILQNEAIKLEAGERSKTIDLQRAGLISPLDHLKLVISNADKGYLAKKPIFIDNVKYDHYVIDLDSSIIKEKLEYFLGPQFSDKITLEQVVNQIKVQYHMAVHPVSYELKQFQLIIGIKGSSDKQLEQNVIFRFLHRSM